jgi:hypothetical protein
MVQATQPSEGDLAQLLTQTNALFRSVEKSVLEDYLPSPHPSIEKLYSSRPVYTAFQADAPLDVLYAIVSGGPTISRSSPLDRVIAISYPGSCFGMRNLSVGPVEAYKGFPTLVEAYKTTNVVKLPLAAIQALYQEQAAFRERYHFLLELREKFQYHLLNCSTYPPQAVASLLRALIYQERSLGNQPDDTGAYVFDLPVDIIARACQLNHRTVEQVLKAMQKEGLLDKAKATDLSGDLVRVTDPEGLKVAYSATRDKVSWWRSKDGGK